MVIRPLAVLTRAGIVAYSRYEGSTPCRGKRSTGRRLVRHTSKAESIHQTLNGAVHYANGKRLAVLLPPKDLQEELVSANHGSESKLDDQHPPVPFPQRRRDNTSSITIAAGVLDSSGMQRGARTQPDLEALGDTLNYPEGAIFIETKLNPEVSVVVNQ